MIPAVLRKHLPWESLLVLVAGFLVACAVTWPLATDVDGKFLAGKFQWSHTWTMEMVYSGVTSDNHTRRPLQGHLAWRGDDHPPDDYHGFIRLDGRGPKGAFMLTCPMLDYPRGGPLTFIAWFNIVVGSLLRSLLTVVASFNLTVLLVLGLAPWAAWSLARGLGAGRAGAAVAALIYGFNPFILTILYNGQLAKYNHAWIPLLVLCAWRLGQGRWLWVPITWVLGIICLGSSPYYFVFSAWLITILCLYMLVRIIKTWRDRGLAAARWLLAGGGIAVLGLPLFYHFSIRENSLISPANPGADTSVFELSASFATLLLPRAVTYAGGVTIPGEQHTVYLGLSVLLLAVLATVALRARGTIIWWVVAVLFLSLAFGRSHVFDHGERFVSLPLSWITELWPKLSAIIFAHRFIIVVFLALAMVVALGLDRVLDRLARYVPRLGGVWPRAGLTALVLAAVAVEYLVVSPAPFPLPVEDVKVPMVYRQMAQDQEMYGVMEYPCDMQGVERRSQAWQETMSQLTQRQVFWQVVHHKGISLVDKGNRTRPAYQTPVFNKLNGYLLNGETPRCKKETRTKEWFKSNGYRYVVYHERVVPRKLRMVLRSCLALSLGKPIPYPNDGLLVYKVLAEGEAATPPQRY